ncbi:MAG: DUF916 domain-containing protein [Candidatus Paceibacterota bacterium]
MHVFRTRHTQESAGAGLAPTNIDPGRIVDPGEQLQEVIRVTNLSDREETYYLSVRDISGVRDNGTPIYAKENTEQTGFELSEWVTLESGELTLASGEERAVGVIVNIPENATPGSHFGGIFVSAVPPEPTTVGAGVGFEVANIVHIRIAGDVVESAQIRTFATDQLFYSTPEVEFSARVENKGNVLVRPYGPLEVYNMLGNRVYSETFNENLGGVFPGTIRDFKFMWSD